jgi:cold shock CspA family protein
MTGTIKTLRFDGLFGFIHGDDGTDYFFHQEDVEGSFEVLQVGDSVGFAAMTPPPKKGPRATNVVVLSAENTAVETGVSEEAS